VEGDFNQDGTQDIAVILAVGEKDVLAYESYDCYLLIGTQEGGKWHRLYLQPLSSSMVRLDRAPYYALNLENRNIFGQFIKHHASALVYDTKRHLIGVDTGEKKPLRKQASVTTTVSNMGHGEQHVAQEPGYDVDKHLIVPFEWDKAAGKFRQLEPCWFISPADEETLNANGVDVDAEREWWPDYPRKSVPKRY
jgi:hypothetical protein